MPGARCRLMGVRVCRRRSRLLQLSKRQKIHGWYRIFVGIRHRRGSAPTSAQVKATFWEAPSEGHFKPVPSMHFCRLDVSKRRDPLVARPNARRKSAYPHVSGLSILKLLKNCDFSIRDISIGEIRFPVDYLSAIPLPNEVKLALAANGGTTSPRWCSSLGSSCRARLGSRPCLRLGRGRSSW